MQPFRWVYGDYQYGDCLSCSRLDVRVFPSWFSSSRSTPPETSSELTEGNKIMTNLNTAVNLGVSTVSAVGGYRGQIKLNVNLADPETGKQLDTGSQVLWESEVVESTTEAASAAVEQLRTMLTPRSSSRR